MTTGASIWFVLFAACAGLFFGIALVVTYRGIRELRDLLQSANRKVERA